MIKYENEPENVIDLLHALCNMGANNKRICDFMIRSNVHINLKNFNKSLFSHEEKIFVEDVVHYLSNLNN
jgi:hypothetical protein